MFATPAPLASVRRVLGRRRGVQEFGGLVLRSAAPEIRHVRAAIIMDHQVKGIPPLALRVHRVEERRVPSPSP